METLEETPDIEIQATVTVPETIVETGEFEYSLPSVELIEEVFTNGEKMEKDVSDAWNDTSWCILSEKDGESTYKKYYHVDLPHHYAMFADQTIQNVVGESYTDETCPDETTAGKMQELTEQAISFFEKSGMDFRFLDRSIEIENGRYMADVDVVSVIDDIPLVSGLHWYIAWIIILRPFIRFGAVRGYR